MKFNNKLKELRINKGLTQKELASISKIPLTTIQKYERGVFEPKLDNLKKLALALDISVSELANNTGQEMGLIYLEKDDAVRRLSENPRKISNDLFEEIIRLFTKLDTLDLVRLKNKNKVLPEEVITELADLLTEINNLLSQDLDKAEAILKKLNKSLEDDQ